MGGRISGHGDVALSAAFVVLWSSGFIGAALGTSEARTDTLLTWRLLIAGLILLAVCLVLRVRVAPAQVPRLAVMGVLGQAVYLGAVFVGIGLGVSAGTTALVTVLQPLVVAALAPWVTGERVTRRQLLGLVIGLVGVGLVVAYDVGTGTAPLWAYGFPVLGMLALSANTLLQRRWQSSASLLGTFTVQVLVAAALFSIWSAVTGHLAPPATAGFWWAQAFMIGLATFGGWGTYIAVIRRHGATRAATLTYLVPPTTMVWALLAFGDPIGVLSLAGTAVVALGVALALLGRGDGAGARGVRSAPPPG